MAQYLLFLCRDNSVRSQIAEGLARHFLGHQADVSSAGSHPAGRVHPMAVAVMAEIGIDISHQAAKGIEAVDMSRVDLIVVVGAESECPVLPAAKARRVSWNIADPVLSSVPREEQLRKFRKIRDQIREQVLKLRAADQVW